MSYHEKTTKVQPHKEVDTYDEVVEQKLIWRTAKEDLVELIVIDTSQDILTKIKDPENEDRKLTIIARCVRRALKEMQ